MARYTMRKYELTFVIGGDQTEDKTAGIVAEVKKLIEGRDGSITKEFAWGKRKLTYQIQKNSFGYYFILIFDLDASLINELTRELNLNNKVIRYLITDFVDETFFEEQAEGQKEHDRERDNRRDDESEKSIASDPAIQEAVSAMGKQKSTVKKREHRAETREESKQSETKSVVAEEAQDDSVPSEKRQIQDEDRKELSDEERKAVLDKKLAEILGEE